MRVEYDMWSPKILTPIGCFLSMACAAPSPAQEAAGRCTNVPSAFVEHVTAVLTDSTDLFRGAYPPATPLTCELLGMLQEELKDDSAHYCFERLSRKYWSEDPGARITHAYIARHMSFPLAMAATAHWNEDHRIRGLLELQSYRRIRPMVCTTKKGYAEREKQDSAAVRYLLRVVETTPLLINGSENSTIHGNYMRIVYETLDLFTGQTHNFTLDQHVPFEVSDPRMQQALADWRKWLAE